MSITQITENFNIKSFGIFFDKLDLTVIVVDDFNKLEVLIFNVKNIFNIKVVK